MLDVITYFVYLRDSITELMVINIHFLLIVRINLQDVGQTLYCKRCTFGGGGIYAKKANEDEQDHHNWMVHNHI